MAHGEEAWEVTAHDLDDRWVWQEAQVSRPTKGGCAPPKIPLDLIL